MVRLTSLSGVMAWSPLRYCFVTLRTSTSAMPVPPSLPRFLLPRRVGRPGAGRVLAGDRDSVAVPEAVPTAGDDPAGQVQPLRHLDQVAGRRPELDRPRAGHAGGAVGKPDAGAVGPGFDHPARDEPAE